MCSSKVIEEAAESEDPRDVLEEEVVVEDGDQRQEQEPEPEPAPQAGQVNL